MVRQTELISESCIPGIINATKEYYPTEDDRSASVLLNGYTIIPVGEFMPSFRSFGRSVCTVTAVLSPAELLATHFTPNYNTAQECIVHKEMNKDPSRKFNVIVISTLEGIDTLVNTLTNVSRRRNPDVVYIPNWEDKPADLTVSQKLVYYQLIHSAKMSEKGLIHTFLVPGTNYRRSGTYEELVNTEPQYIYHSHN